MIVQNKLEKVECPFNPLHIIERRRLMVHIHKCKKLLPKNHDFVTCKFSNLHYVRKHKLAEHNEVCEYQQEFVAHKVICDAIPAKFEQPELTVIGGINDCFIGGSWEDLSEPARFNPEKVRQQCSFMILPEGMPKIKRRQFRELERLRLKELEEKSSTSKMKNQENYFEPDKPPKKTEPSVSKNGVQEEIRNIILFYG